MYSMLLVTQGVIPLALLLWQGLLQDQNRLAWGLKTLLVATMLGIISVAGLWSVFFPWWMPYVFLGIWVVLAIASFWSIRDRPIWPRRQLRGIAYITILGVLVGLLGSLLSQILVGLNPPAIAPISLEFPLSNGTYQVLNGGNHVLVNAHLKTLDPNKYRNYYGQSYGVDLVKLNSIGTRAIGFLPQHMDAYEIYGMPVGAPCQGQVIATENQHPDMIPPSPDRQNLLGNHVLLRCQEADVLLAHLQPNSIHVEIEEEIQVGQLLGKVGNSGNTNEPHLHIHAQRAGSATTPIDGDPLPILFSDRYLVRNNRIKAPEKLYSPAS